MKQDIIQNLINATGQSQKERHPSALDAHFVDIDERSTEDLLTFMKRFSRLVNFYGDNPATPSSDWQNFFPYTEGQGEAWINEKTGSVPPHLALMHAFLRLYREPQAQLNQFTSRHLNFYYQNILQLARKKPVPDTAHVQVLLKKQAPPVLVTPEMVFSAGKDDTGTERLYRPLIPTLINHASLASIRSVYRDAANQDRLRLAPIANSANGLGEAFTEDEPHWFGFGHPALQTLADIGFALSSPVLRMAEGSRRITLTLTLDNLSSDNLLGTSLNHAFKIYLSAEKSWLGPLVVTPTLSGSVMTLDLTITAEQEALVDYQREVHGYNFATRAPVIQVLVNHDRTDMGPARFEGIRIRKAKISVSVSNIQSLTLENDAGTLNPKKSFQPFGSQPRVGTRFLVGYPEAFSKKLSELKLHFTWKSPPSNFTNYYAHYSSIPSNNSFTVAGSFKDAGGWSVSETGKTLFNSTNAQLEHSITFTRGATTSTAPTSSSSGTSSSSNYQIAHALGYYNAAWAQVSFFTLLLQHPVFYPVTSAPAPAKQGFLTLSLQQNFRHEAYRREYVEKIMAFSKQTSPTPALQLLNEPYTPEIQDISLSYSATSDEINIDANSLEEFAREDIHFFHIDCFGQMREHAYQRGLFNHLLDKSVSLIPRHDAQGELLIGLDQLNPGDSISLLFQVAEGSADPDAERQALRWSVLCDNYWRSLSRDELFADATDHLLTSGILQLVIPRDATHRNSVMPDGLIWLKASVPHNTAAICQLIDILPNSFAVRADDRHQGPVQVATLLPAKSISKLKVPVAGVAKVIQPFTSFGATPTENDRGFHTRVAERLRHKHQPRTIWDIERMLLDAFPQLHRVKCIPHAKPGNWLAPGNITLVVIPDLTNKNAMDPLQPRTDSHTLAEIHDFLTRYGGMQVNYFVRNPSYQTLQLAFKVKFRPGHDFNYYRKQLNQDLLRYLSPWAFHASGLEFGGSAYKPVLLDFVEELPYVDYLGDFSLYTYFADTDVRQDIHQALPLTPDAILVSARQHAISEFLSAGTE